LQWSPNARTGPSHQAHWHTSATHQANTFKPKPTDRLRSLQTANRRRHDILEPLNKRPGIYKNPKDRVEKVEREAKAGNALALPLPSFQRHYRPKRSSTATRKYGASSRSPYPQSSTGVCILLHSVEILIRHHLPRRRHRHTAPKIHWKIRLPGSRQCRDISSSELTLIRRIMHTRSPIVETVGHFGLQPPLRDKGIGNLGVQRAWSEIINVFANLKGSVGCWNLNFWRLEQLYTNF
jgi:hypothetical protein